MLLYDSPVSGNCFKVRLLFAHLGVEYERRTVDVVDRSNRPELLGGLNPALRVPTLVLDDGRSLAESGAILWFFGERTSFVPDDAFARAQVLQWMFFEQYDHEPAIAVARFWLAYSGLPELFEPQREEKTKAGRRALRAMERHLDGRDWFVGDSITLADIALYAYTHVADEGGFDLDRYEAIPTWLDRVASCPGQCADRRLTRRRRPPKARSPSRARDSVASGRPRSLPLGRASDRRVETSAGAGARTCSGTVRRGAERS